MAEIEKKYSDYQTSECDTQEPVEPIDPRLCPTCQINPDWKLPSAHWSMIQEAYLNESVCEYHVRAYEREKSVQPGLPNYNIEPQEVLEAVKIIAVERILVDLDKPLNDGTRQQLMNAVFIVDTFQEYPPSELGLAYLVGVPAFNMDQILPNDSDEAEESAIEEGSGGEILVDLDGLNRKLSQLRVSLNTYEKFYTMAQKAGAGFVIRQKNTETNRINYGNARKKIKNFKSELNDKLASKGYPRIGNTGIFKSKRFKKIKFVFRPNGKAYDLKKVYVLDADCDKYIKIPIPNGHLLRKPSMRVVYHFLENLDQVINDITAKETKPWLDFTLENFYPEHIVDYGNLAKIEDTKAGLECLLELELGIGNGQVIDSLTAEIMSAFDTIEKQIAEEACRSLAEQASGGATALAEQNNLGKPPSEERELAMKARYQKEFENKIYKDILSQATKQVVRSNLVLSREIQIDPNLKSKILPKPTKKNVFDYDFIIIGYTVLIQAVKPLSRETKTISNTNDVINFAKDLAGIKFNKLEGGSFGNQIQNSPHYDEAKEAAEEIIADFENTYIKPVKDAISGESEIELVDLIPTIGVCGMSKIAGKALKCLTNGVSFDDFLDILIEKTFDFMEVNTLGLFLNGLPNSFRQELNEEIEKQFGSGVDISTLLGIKQAEGGGQKMKDFVKSKQTAKRVLELFEKYERPYASGTNEEKNILLSSLGPNIPRVQNAFDQIQYEMSVHYDRVNKVYIDGPITRKINEKEKEYKKREKFVLKFIKNKIREYKKSQNKFRQAVNRIGSALGDASEARSEARDAIRGIPAERDAIVSQIAEVDSLIEILKNYSRDVMTSDSFFNPGGTIRFLTDEELRAAQLKELKSIATELAGYREQKQTLTGELEYINSGSRREDIEDDYLAELASITGIDDISVQNALAIIDRGFANVGGQIYSAAETAGGSFQAFDDAEGVAENIAAGVEVAGDLLNQVADGLVVTASEEDELNDFEQAAKSFEETALGVKVDAVFDIIFDFAIDSIMDAFSLDELFEMLRSYPAVDFALDKIEQLFLKPCPVAPVIYPPPSDFMKSLSIDVCDGTAGLTAPKIIVPNISLRFQLEYEFSEIFREAVIKLVSDIAIRLLKRLMSTLESALCNLVEAAGGIVADGLRGNLKGSFYRALNEAFCNDGEDPATSKSKAEELADALFAPLSFDSGEDYTGSGARVANIISSVATTEEFLEGMVARDGEENDQFNQRVANAVTALAPEMEVLLGDPNQVAYFFKSLGSFLPADDRARIRDLLDAGVPNLPISSAICLTNDQLDEWNKMREQLLGGDDPAGTVKKLNEETKKALEETMDDVAELDTDGPFIGALTNEAMKDVCNPNNLFNDVSQSPTDKALSDELVEGFFENIQKILTMGFTTRGGLLAEAMRDTADRREFGRKFQKLFRYNYADSQEERDTRVNDPDTSKFVKFFMNAGSDDDGDGTVDAIGVYPETVGIRQRKEILEGGMLYNFDEVKSGKSSSRNVVYRFSDSFEGFLGKDFSYVQKVAASNLRKPKKTFGYNLQVIENINDEDPFVEVNMNTPVQLSLSENTYLESKGFQYKSNEKQDIRKAAFEKILKSKIPIGTGNSSNIYEKLFETSNKKLVEALLTSGSDGLPIGYKFGYVSDDLTAASFEYIPSPNEGELGEFVGFPRVRALDPSIYGGRYSNPPYYVEPRKFTGWLELATTAFKSQDGCDPKTPPLLSFKDIETRTKNLGSSLKSDPRLSKSRDCTSIKPFHLLLNGKTKASMDGVVRTTIRTYITEFFMKGYGLLSNLQIRSENFDASFSSYIAKKMQSEMSELGTFTSNKKVRIVRERYWYTFLEQSVEAYQRMIDVDGIEPPPAVFAALNKIQRGLDKYRVVDKKMKKKLRKEINDLTLRRPAANYDPIEEVNKGSRYNLAMAIAFRLAKKKDDERESFFDGQVDENVTRMKVRYANLKKLQFFQKIYFIKLFEKEALIVMSEFIRNELNRMSDLVIDGPIDKPYYFDLYKSFFGMQSFFPDGPTHSTSRVGLNSYYLDKQTGLSPDAGSIPTIKSSNLISPIQPSDEPQYVVESYVRLVEREEADIPDFIRTRDTKYLGAVSLTDMSQFIDQNLERLEEKSLSDYFGDLTFTYSGRIYDLFEKGFALKPAVERLIELNPEKKDTIEKAFREYVMPTVQTLGEQTIQASEEQVIYDESFILEGETPTPTGTIGSTGVKYGLRVSIMLPNGMITSDVRARPDLIAKSKEEKAFLFEDGGVMIPLSSTEIDVVDAKFEDFDPFSGTERYDLECLINKIVDTPEFTVMFDKILNFRQASSMLAIYCMETLPAAIGRDESERYGNVFRSGNPDTDDWDRTVNKFGKNFLRREFKSLYLSETEDGLSTDNDDDESSMVNLIKINNPFDNFALPSVRIPWWLKRRMKTKIYDANGVACADPEKDLR